MTKENPLIEKLEENSIKFDATEQNGKYTAYLLFNH